MSIMSLGSKYWRSASTCSRKGASQRSVLGNGAVDLLPKKKKADVCFRGRGLK
jgi:hypothetical protein